MTLGPYRLTIWYIALSDGQLQFLAPIDVDAVDEAESARTGSSLARSCRCRFAAKVMVWIEGDGVDRSIELQA